MAEETMTCPVCGGEFIPHTKIQVYCGKECAKKAKKKHDIEYNKKHAERIRQRNIARVLESKVKVPKRSGLDALSGEELLHYGAVQQRINADLLRVHIPDNIKGKENK